MTELEQLRRIKMQRRELRRLNKKMYDHAFERHRLKCRIAELEAMDEFRMDPETGTLEVDHVGPEPTLDPARVLATAAEMMRETGYKGNGMIYAMSHASKDAKPYRLKGGDDVG